jgi:autotransporter-associated beta strand protein
VFVALAFVRLPAQITWTGAAADQNMTNSANWSGAFVGTGSDDLIFGPSLNLVANTPINGALVRNITFNGTERGSYSIGGTWALTLNGDVTVSTTGDVTFAGGLPLQLSDASHVFDVAADTTVTVAGSIGGAGNSSSLVKNGAGTLELDASDSSFRGGVTLNAGWLLIGAYSSSDVESTPPVRWGPVGRGTLTLNGGTIAPVADITLHNPIALTGNTKLADCDTEYAITFAGNISGSGAFDAHGYGDIYFNGNNSGWTGGVTFYGDNDIYVNSATGLGTGPVAFATYENYSYLYLNASHTINGLSGGYVTMGEGYDGSEIQLNQNVTLTVNQATDAEYGGSIGGYDYWGTTQVNQGGLIIDGTNGGYFANSAVEVNNGGTFGVKNDAYVYSTVTVKSGGKLVGDGFVTEGIIQSGGTLSPGFNSGNKLGKLSFEDLTINGGGTLEFNLKTDGQGGMFSDEIAVQNSATLTINATPANRFSLKVISLNSDGNAGALTGTFLAGSSYSWLLFDTNGIYDANSDSNVFTPGSFQIDDTQFSAGIAGSFSLSQAGSDIYLTFTPVPEPSTYALMALGLVSTGFAAWRRRRA